MISATLYYGGLLALSFLLTVVYVFRWHKYFDVHLTAMFFLIPVVNLCYFLMYQDHDPDTAILALKVIYIGSCYLPWLTVMCITSLCRIPVRRWVRTLTFLLSSAMYACVLTIGHYPLFYKSLTLEKLGGMWIQQKEYGPFHTVFYVVLALYLLADLTILSYCFLKKKQVSRRILVLLVLPVLIAIGGYFANHILKLSSVDPMPLSYTLAQLVYLYIAYRMPLYDVSDMMIESMVQSDDTGFISIDFKDRYLGSNETAKAILPALRDLTVDHSIQEEEALRDNVLAWVEHFKADPGAERFRYVRKDPADGEGDAIYAVQVSYLHDGRTRRGYQIFLEDDTQNQKYIALLDQYNFELKGEVALKTARILEMHDNLILSMAAMVESRDNSTGGHIRRTSEGVRILVEEMRKDPALSLTDSFCKSLIKAAPMHDLGKIAVDDAILRKPGVFTREEFEIMKNHAAEGARIVHEILKETDDENFRRIAENVAHYHHERMDGSGYPAGLTGDNIPLEARIMAIADVYDALVSKRVYKEKFSFADADRIILEGMGQQFDPRLRPYYEAARPKLESYYSNQ